LAVRACIGMANHTNETARKIDQKPSLLDDEGFNQIHREYRHRLIDSVTGFVRDRAKAEDIVDRTFQKAWEKRDAFRGGALPTTWLESIARNEARQWLGRDRADQFDSIDSVDASELRAPELVTDELEKRYDRLRLEQALAQLPDKQRRALTAHFIEGFSIREIAHREQVPIGTVLSRIHTGKQLLRDAWEAAVRTSPDKASADLSWGR
jgi:RNA polymerase sigma-70 factor (ECF subfamily)